jgi:crossover junction endodeoxyribonuclease RuvC
MRKRRNTVALGIDPGSRRIGYGCVAKEGGSFRILAAGVLELHAGEERDALRELRRALVTLFARYKPDVVAVEHLFVTKNKKTAMAVLQARGVILETAATLRLPCAEFSPSHVKSAIAGDGRADKKTVAKMVALWCGVREVRVRDDASDALALALLGAVGAKAPEAP